MMSIFSTRGLVCTLALCFGPLANQGDAGLWGCHSSYGGYGYGAGYYGTPVSYSAGYGYSGGYGCCLTSLFSGCGLFGCARPYYSGYGPACYAPSTCGSCYAPSGCCCPNYGCSIGGLCCGDGCSTGGCGITSGSASGVSPYSPEPALGGNSTDPPPPNRPPSTYREDDTSRPFMPPEPIDGANSGSEPPAVLPSNDGGTILPSGGEAGDNSPPNTPTDTDSEVERGDFKLFKIPAKDDPANEPETEDEPAEDSTLTEPLGLESAVAIRLFPERRRAHYRAIFRTPQVARNDVPSRSGWKPIPNTAQLASSR